MHRRREPRWTRGAERELRAVVAGLRWRASGPAAVSGRSVTAQDVRDAASILVVERGVDSRSAASSRGDAVPLALLALAGAAIGKMVGLGWVLAAVAGAALAAAVYLALRR